MEKIEFNKNLFVKNDDIVFKIAVMFSNFVPLSSEIQDVLLKSNVNIIQNNINFFTFTEMYNETVVYTNNWILALDNITDETEWEFHRSKLLTRFTMTKKLPSADVNRFLKEFKVEYPRCAKAIQNASILWNNAVGEAKFAWNQGLKSPKAWKLWKALLGLRDGDHDKVRGDESLLKEYKRITDYRFQDEFYQTHDVNIIRNLKLVKQAEIEKQLSTIFFKNKLSKEIPVENISEKKLKI